MPARPRFDRPIAHRGLHDRARGIIENSASAFEAAIARGFTIECDVQLSRDGVAVVFHDDDLERLTGLTGPVHQRGIAELTATPLLGSSTGDRPQRFTDFLTQVAGRTLLQIELKRQPDVAMTRALAQSVVDALASYTGPVTLESFDPALIVALRRCGVRMPIGVITYGYDEPDWDSDLPPMQRYGLRHLLHWPMTRFDFISCRDTSLDLPAVRFFRRLGMPITTWTIRSPAAALATVGKADQIVFEGFDPEPV